MTYGNKHAVYARIAGYGDAVYIDLCNDEWQAIEIKADGWRVINDPPVKFVRSNGMLPLPMPKPGGSLEALKPFLNVGEDGFILAIACVVGTLKPYGPYPILSAQGEQGSTKTTFVRILRSCVDPSKAPVRSSPKDERDLILSAQNSHILAFDNLSDIKIWFSDALCRISTGGGYATRQLYTDGQEIVFQAMRPIILNSISQIVFRHDLVDRCIFCHLDPIPPSKRRLESDIRAEFDKVHPYVLGALCDAVSTALRRKNEVAFDTLPRMADFATWVQAAEPALPWEDGQFIALYNDNREGAIGQAIESDPVAYAITIFMEDESEWIGTATELLEVLNQDMPEEIRKIEGWPESAIALGLKLSRISAFLRESGIEIERDGRTRKDRIIKIRNLIR